MKAHHLLFIVFISFCSVFADTELISNPNFDNGLTDWSFMAHNSQGAYGDFTSGMESGDNIINVSISNGGTVDWHVQGTQSDITLKNGSTYTFSWTARRTAGDPIVAGVQRSSGNYMSFFNDEITGTGNGSGDWITKTTTFTHESATESGLRIYVNMGSYSSNLGISKISLIEHTNENSSSSANSSSSEIIDPGYGPVSYYGELITSGKHILGEKTNSPAQVKGMSMFWSNTYWGGDAFYNSNVIDALVSDWKVEVVRAALGVMDAGKIDGGYEQYPDANKARINTVVQAAIDNGIYVIIDFHTHDGEGRKSEAITFFTEMAQTWGAYDNVIFEIYNEPLNVSWNNVLKPYSVDLIKVIRQYSDNLIIVGTPNWSQDLDVASYNKITSSDFEVGQESYAENIAYTLHFYAGTHGSSLRSKANTALSANMPVFVTEYGTVNANGDGAVAETSSDEWMTWMDNNNISWCNWSVNDKSEGASAFESGQNMSGGSDYLNTNKITASGEYVLAELLGHATQAEWRLASSSSSEASSSSEEVSSSSTPWSSSSVEMVSSSGTSSMVSSSSTAMSSSSESVSSSSEEVSSSSTPWSSSSVEMVSSSGTSSMVSSSSTAMSSSSEAVSSSSEEVSSSSTPWSSSSVEMVSSSGTSSMVSSSSTAMSSSSESFSSSSEEVSSSSTPWSSSSVEMVSSSGTSSMVSSSSTAMSSSSEAVSSSSEEVSSSSTPWSSSSVEMVSSSGTSSMVSSSSTAMSSSSEAVSSSSEELSSSSTPWSSSSVEMMSSSGTSSMVSSSSTAMSSSSEAVSSSSEEVSSSSEAVSSSSEEVSSSSEAVSSSSEEVSSSSEAVSSSSEEVSSSSEDDLMNFTANEIKLNIKQISAREWSYSLPADHEVMIVNLLGKPLMKGFRSGQNDLNVVSLSESAKSGIYYLRIISGSQVSRTRLVVR